MERNDPAFKKPRHQNNDPMQVARMKVDHTSYFCGACDMYLSYGGCDCEAMWGHRMGCSSHDRYCDNRDCPQYRVVI